jgi:ABC-type branched-subunit amino acid transport system substrate-binding protein
MALTGGLAPNGKAALLAMQIWESDINAKGGLLGRPVKLIYYDDQSNPATIPGLYTKLLDVDKVDLIISGYGTNMIAPAMPIIMQHNRTFLSLLGLAVNTEFKYPKYFSFTPTGGPEPKQSFTAGFFATAMAQNPKPQTLAMVGADAEFPHNAMDGARVLAKQHGLKVVYDQTYPPATTDYTPIVRAIQATNPDLVLVCSYPPDTVGMVRAAHEVGLKAKLFGGGMVGLQSTAIKVQLGPLLNGIVDYDFWLPCSAESARGISPRAAHRTGLEPLDSSGSCHPLKTAVFHRHQQAPPVSRWPIDVGVSDPPPSLHPRYRDFITTTRQSAPASRIGNFSLAVSPACAFSLGIDRQVLKFRALAWMRFTPPLHRTPREQ